ncbi:MAG: DeoR/GlpR family DNA-binding transcription regulator [Natronospirillum sp.]|uniref:DeoR/GlpR family DNA-binding transcription regulator n=1 Tax=Natronospirillum sp. TaxID=2812955 RepID=UPI0025F0EF01|nr:DeoR/GlpR family DNA-binding transcription regulator [Natronospirillum sp.]MCH8551882.1 DeoR/GlpR family DNA-binding transcription regulator [Natronospirillum sp.]
MRPEDRRDDIVEFLIEKGSASVDVLADKFGVSKMTIHRDLDFLEDDGLLRKVRGGASIEASGQFESDFRYRARVATDEKREIAQRAAGFIEPGTSVMIDDGSTSLATIPYLLKKVPLTVITNNLAIIEQLSGKPGITLIALGGSYARKFNGFFGVLTHNALSTLRADIALLSTSAITGSTAYHQDQEILAVKRQMIESASATYLMADHQKFGKTALHVFSHLSEFDGVIVSPRIPSETVGHLQQEGVRLYFTEDHVNDETILDRNQLEDEQDSAGGA